MYIDNCVLLNIVLSVSSCGADQCAFLYGPHAYIHVI